MSNVHIDNYYNDQNRLNHALAYMNPIWEGDVQTMNKSVDRWKATTPDGFTITILSEKEMCRRGCTAESLVESYVYHKCSCGASKADLHNNKLGPWYLRDDWEEISKTSTAVGEEWLKEVTISK